MKIITLEDHFATPMLQEKRPPIPQAGIDGIAARGCQLGHDIEVELLDLTGSRIKAMDEAGIDLQIVSLTMPGTEAFPPAIAIPMAADANDRLAAAVKARPDRFAGIRHAADLRSRSRGEGAGARRQDARLQGRDDQRPHPGRIISTTRNTGRSSRRRRA